MTPDSDSNDDQMAARVDVLLDRFKAAVKRPLTPLTGTVLLAAKAEGATASGPLARVQLDLLACRRKTATGPLEKAEALSGLAGLAESSDSVDRQPLLHGLPPPPPPDPRCIQKARPRPNPQISELVGEHALLVSTPSPQPPSPVVLPPAPDWSCPTCAAWYRLLATRDDGTFNFSAFISPAYWAPCECTGSWYVRFNLSCDSHS